MAKQKEAMQLTKEKAAKPVRMQVVSCARILPSAFRWHQRSSSYRSGVVSHMQRALSYSSAEHQCSDKPLSEMPSVSLAI